MPIGPRYVGDTELPWDPGEHAGPEVRPDEIPGVDYQDGRWSLTGLTRDHRLYSAVVLAALGLPRDPVAVYWAENNLPEHDSPYWVDVGRVVLGGGIPAPFDQVLFACPNQYAAGLITFLDRLSVRSGAVVAHSVRQRVPVVDWRLLDQVAVAPPTPPTVLVDLYGYETDDLQFVWQPPADPWRQPVRLVRQPRPKPKKPKGKPP